MINFKPAAGPYAHTENSSTRIMYQVVLALLPATIWRRAVWAVCICCGTDVCAGVYWL
ncbi:hypothetical protein ACFSJQ_02085 [Vibrio olivae]